MVGAIGVFAWQALNRPPSPAVTPAPSRASAALAVDRFMRNVDDYPGVVTVEGVVSTVTAHKKMLALIDRAEWDECGSVSCARLTLPVRWDGPWPDVQTLVRIKGQARQVDGKLIFVAESIAPASQGEGQGR